MKTPITLAVFLFLSAPFVAANDSVAMAPIKFQITTEDALAKFEQTIKSPEGLLKRYKPVGAKISRKQVSQNQMSFVATKTVLFISKSVYVNGILDAHEDSKSCAKNEMGYSLEMSFDASDRIVSNNVERIQATLCLKELADNKITGVAHSKIIIGNNYSSTLGPVAVNLVKEQVPALLDALTKEITSLR
jgi:hypothetical protein